MGLIPRQIPCILPIADRFRQHSDPKGSDEANAAGFELIDYPGTSIQRKGIDIDVACRIGVNDIGTVDTKLSARGSTTDVAAGG